MTKTHIKAEEPFTTGVSTLNFQKEDEELQPPPDDEVTDADRESGGLKPDNEPDPIKYDLSLGLPVSIADRPPSWAKIPKGFVFPIGIRPIFLRFKAEITRAPRKGERQCILWELTDTEEIIAARRGVMTGRQMQEGAKQTVRAIDGYPVDWSGVPGPGKIEDFWTDIGPKGRQMICVVYMRTHQLTDVELNDFFSNCAAVRTVV